MAPTLIIANKAYSSWSFRPWILLRHFDIPFEEIVVPLDLPSTREQILAHSPAGKCPALRDGTTLVFDSLAIIEYIAESYPQKPIWPAAKEARALARSLSAEMHSGFQALRSQCPMNFRRQPRPIALGADVQADIARIQAGWADARRRFGSGKPFLFGDFSAADAMFAPVVNRFLAYAIEVTPESRAYMDAMVNLPAWQQWQRDVQAEPWRIEKYEAI